MLPKIGYPLLIASLLALAPYVHSETAPELAIKEQEPKTGSMLRRNVAESNSIPINLRYEQLTEDQKNSLKSSYNSMGPDDEPPFPVEGLKSIITPLEKAQQRILARGDLYMVVTVSSDGNGTSVKVFSSPDSEMTQFVARLLILTKYKPALCSGKACSQDFPFRMKFDVRL